MDLGRRPEARFPDSEVMLLDREIDEADIAYVIEHIGLFGDDNRAGIERTLHRISAIRNRTGKGDHRHDHGVFAPVRTYESPIDRRLEEAGFESIASVTLLMKETLVRVAEPALVPAGVR